MSSSDDTAYPALGSEAGPDTPNTAPTEASAGAGEAAAAWRALAPLMAARPIVRESANGGRAYPAKGTRALTERLPTVPAAIPIYSKAGDTRLLVIDLDTSKADRSAERIVASNCQLRPRNVEGSERVAYE